MSMQNLNRTVDSLVVVLNLNTRWYLGRNWKWWSGLKDRRNREIFGYDSHYTG